MTVQNTRGDAVDARDEHSRLPDVSGDGDSRFEELHLLGEAVSEGSIEVVNTIRAVGSR